MEEWEKGEGDLFSSGRRPSRASTPLREQELEFEPEAEPMAVGHPGDNGGVKPGSPEEDLEIPTYIRRQSGQL